MVHIGIGKAHNEYWLDFTVQNLLNSLKNGHVPRGKMVMRTNMKLRLMDLRY